MIRCETSDLMLDRTLRVYCHLTIYIHFLFWKEKATISSPLFSVYPSLSLLYNTELYSRRLTTELGTAAGVLSAVWAGHSSIRDESRHMFLSWLCDNGSCMTWRAPEMTKLGESIHHSDKRRRKITTFFLERRETADPRCSSKTPINHHH